MSGIAFYPPATNTARIPTDAGCTEMKNAMPAGRRIRESENVRIFQAVFKRVFRGQKIVACFLKLVARISKSEPLIFSLLPCGVNALKTSFHFSRPETAFLRARFSTVPTCCNFVGMSYCDRQPLRPGTPYPHHCTLPSVKLRAERALQPEFANSHVGITIHSKKSP